MEIQVQKKWFKSKRLWMAVATLVLIVLADAFGLELDMEKVLGMVSIALGYILGQSFEDAKVRSAKVLSDAAGGGSGN